MKKVCFVLLAVMLLAIGCNAATDLPKDPPVLSKMYSDQRYLFEFKYPDDWEVLPQQNGFDASGSTLWAVIVNSQDNEKSFSVRITKKPEAFIFTAPTTQVEVNGQAHNAYILTQGYECYGNESQDCSVFFVPLKNEDRWYILQGNGNVSDDLSRIYSEILSTFRFTR